MGGELQFEEEGQYRSPVVLGKPEIPKMILWLKKTGIVKDEKRAGNILLIIILICVVVSIIAPFFILGNNELNINAKNYHIMPDSLITGAGN